MSDSNKNSFFEGDKALLLRLKKFKDREAFLSAYEAYAADIYRFLYFKVGSHEEAQDLTSSTFIKAWSVVQSGGLKDGDDYKSLKAFLYKIARNQAIDYYRQNKSETFSNLSSEDQDFDIADDLQTEDARINSLDAKLMMDKLAQLKAEYRSILVMYYINELSVVEIAQITGKTKGNVRVLIFRALKALRTLVDADDTINNSAS